MKKTVKIVTLVLSAILLIGCVVGISVSAEETPTVSVKYKNLAYEGAIQVLYAVDAQNVPSGAKVQMYFYDAEPTAESSPAYVKDAYTDEELIIGGVKYYAFFSKGIAPKDMRKAIYAVPVIVDGDTVTKGECVEYSIYTYAINMFAKSPTAEQKALYSSLLDYGASVQQVLLDTGDYTVAELEASGYADQYCGVRISTRVDDTVVKTDAPIYFRPGAAVLTADAWYEDAFFTGFYDAESGKVVGEYGLENEVVLDGADIVELQARYFSDVAIDDYTNSVISDSKYSVNSNLVSNTTYNTLADIGTEDAPNKALKHSHVSDTNTGNVMYGYYTTGKAFVFEADMKWSGTDTTLTSNNWQIRFGFVPVSREAADLKENDRFAVKNFFSSTAGDALYASDAAGYTENTPKYESAKIALNDWTRVRYEYVPTGSYGGNYFGVQRAYFDGVLAYELVTGSTYDDTHMATFFIETRKSTNAGAWELLIDNSVCYTVHEDYYGKGLYVNNADVNTYDGNNKNQNTGTVIDGYNGEKILELVKVNGTSGGVSFSADGIEYGEKYVFETDIRWIDAPFDGHPRNWHGRIGFVSEASSKVTSDNENYIRANYIGSTPTGGGVIGYTADTYDDAQMKNPEFLPGVWYNLRVEYTPTGVNADGFHTGIQKVYINNELWTSYSDTSAKTEKFEKDPNKGLTKDNVGLVAFKFGLLGKTGATIQFDNTFVGAVGMAKYVKDTNFEDGNVTQTLYTTTTDTEAVASYEVVDNPVATDDKAATNKVLKVNQVASTADKEANKLTISNSTAAQTKGVYAIEYDMLYDSASLPKNGVFSQLVVQQTSGYMALFTLNHTGEGNVKITSDVNGDDPGKGGTFGTVKLLDGNWHTLRFVLYKNSTDSVYALYVDGELVGIGNYYHNIAACVTNQYLGTYVQHRIYKWNPADETTESAAYYLDNMYFAYLGDIPAEIPDWTPAE